MNDFNMNNNAIINLALPTKLEDATTKQYVDENFLRIHWSNRMTGEVDTWNQKIRNVAIPASFENDAAVNVRVFDSETNASNRIFSPNLQQITTNLWMNPL